MKAIFFEDLENDHIADILQEIYLNRVYDPFLSGKKDLTIFDFGMNIGLWSYYASQFGTVYGFEPSKAHVEKARKTFEFNGVADKIKTFQAAISNENSTTRLYHSVNSTAHSLTGLTGNEEYEDVEAWTVKKAMEQAEVKHIDFLKLDIEGWEFKVLASKEFKDLCHNIDVIVGEYHTWTNTAPIQLINMLKDYGYKADWTNKSVASTFYATRL